MPVYGTFMGTGGTVRGIAAAAALTLLAGCAGRPTGVLLPVAAVETIPGTSRVDMLVATTRKSAPTAACCSPASAATR